MSLFEYLPPGEAFPKAKAAAQMALDIDPMLAEAYASLGLAKFQHDWDWAGAEAALKKAIELNPNYAPGHHFFADYLKGMGRFDEALEQIREAQALDPLSIAISSGVGHVLYLSRRYDEAIEAYRRSLELDPKSVLARLWFGRPFLQKGQFDEAIHEIRQAVELSKESTISLAVLAHAYAAAGQKAEALEILQKLRERSNHQYVPSYWIGLVHVGLGDNDRALDWLEKAYDEHSAWLAWANVEPRFDPLRDEPRFKQLVAKIGF
jgi:tetratricopeptide (TPR) repeat protein